MRITLVEFCETYQAEMDWDSQKGCFYLYDPYTDNELTPCLMSEQDLERWLNDNLEKVLEKVKERQATPDEYDRMAA